MMTDDRAALVEELAEGGVVPHIPREWWNRKPEVEVLDEPPTKRVTYIETAEWHYPYHEKERHDAH